MTESAKLLEKMRKNNIVDSYDELCHYMRLNSLEGELGADAIEALIADLNNAMQYIPHLCTTCRYYKLITEPERDHQCTNPDQKKPCYVWRPENWEWDGGPKRTDTYKLWKWQ